MLLVLSAPKRSGKDVVADILKRKHSYKRVGLADPLKKICSKVFNLPEDFFFLDDLKDTAFESPIILSFDHLDCLANLVQATELERGLLFKHGKNMSFDSPRAILQKVGTELVRTCVGDDFWINLAISEISKMQGNIIVTDARLPNERAALKAIGGVLIRLKRDGYEGVGHISETSMGDDLEYDVIINNNGTLSELEHDIVMWHTLRFSK